MIEIRHVGHEFSRAGTRGEPQLALLDVTFAIPDGAFVSILGPSGCGKTTLLRIVHGLVRPTAGEVLVDGTLVRKPSADRAMVFQDFALLPWRSAQANAEFGLKVQGAAVDARRSRAADALRLVGLPDFARHFPHEMSGGMKQRLGLARALATSPRTLLMDEPFASLDLQSRELMQVELMRLWEDDRKTVVFVTHSVDEAVFLSDRVIVLSARPGRVVRNVEIRLPRPRWQDPDQVRSSPEFLDYRRFLWSTLKECAPEVAA